MTVRRYRAPQSDGELLFEPAVNTVVRSLLDPVLPDSGEFLALKQFARQEVFALAAQYTRFLSNLAGLPSNHVPVPHASHQVIMTGHQPEWFHPGVLAKNIAIDAISKELRHLGQDAIAINLIVDSDELDDVAIPVPSGNRESPEVVRIPFSTRVKHVPWEEVLTPRELDLGTFSQSIVETLMPWQVVPAISELKMPANGPTSMNFDSVQGNPSTDSSTSPRLCDLVASVRRQWEHSEEIDNLEIPLSQIASTQSFRNFLLDWLRNADSYRGTYNQVVQTFRDESGIQGTQRPVPNLLSEQALQEVSISDQSAGDRAEVPFWVWMKSEGSAPVERERLFVRRDDERLELSTSKRIIGYLPASPHDAEMAIEQLSAWASQGLRIRSRALTTTLFARLYLCDLFVHGIGGAIYDQVTDRMIETIYRQPVPQYLVVTATLHLPLGKGFSASLSDVRRHRALLRDVEQNPWRHLPSCEEISSDSNRNHKELCAQLASLCDERDLLLLEQRICDQKSDRTLPRRIRRQRNRQRYLRLNEIRAELLVMVSPQIQKIREDIETLSQEVAANKILKSREYPWCLFPRDQLHQLVDRIQTAVGLSLD